MQDSGKKFIFIIHEGDILFNGFSEALTHKEWAKSMGIVDEDYNNMVRGTCAKVDGKWHADFYYDYDREDGRCAAAARKFAPEIMKYCDTNSLEILSDEEPFTITKEPESENAS